MRLSSHNLSKWLARLVATSGGAVFATGLALGAFVSPKVTADADTTSLSTPLLPPSSSATTTTAATTTTTTGLTTTTPTTTTTTTVPTTSSSTTLPSDHHDHDDQPHHLDDDADVDHLSAVNHE